MTKTTAPYGSWISPITTDLIAGQSLRLDGLTVDGTTLVWCESRPAEEGRTVLVRRNAAGEIVASRTKFPSGMPAFASYLKARGMRLGLYTARNYRTCCGCR